MRVGILSAPQFVNTGYGVQCALLLRVLKALGHECAVFSVTGLQYGSIMADDVPIYPALFAEMGNDLACHARHFGADVVVAITDLWTMDLDAWEGQKLIAWFPVDHSPLSPMLAVRIPRVEKALVYSRFGQEVCAAAGLDVSYLPCMVDTATFHPIDRAAARQALDWPHDRYIVGMVAANAGRPSRKAFFEHLRAFKRFQDRHPAALLYLHTFANAGGEVKGENILGMLQALGLKVDVDVLFPDQYHYLIGLPPGHMALCYNGVDVLLACATGEGFCVPLVESQACGTPVVCGSWTSMSELCFAGWLVPHDDDDILWGDLMGFKVRPKVSAIVEALEQAYQERGDSSLRARARQGAQAYDVRAIAPMWRGVLS